MLATRVTGLSRVVVPVARTTVVTKSYPIIQQRTFIKLPEWFSFKALGQAGKRVSEAASKASKETGRYAQQAGNYAKKADVNWREALKGVGRSVKDTWKAETKRYNEYYEATQQGLMNRRQQMFNTVKYHLKHTPIYVFKITKVATYYGWQVTKILARTRAGGAVITLIGLWYGTQLLYIYGTRRTKEVYITDKFQRNDYSETDGLTGYLFTDSKNDNYRVVGSLMYMQFYPVELWTSIRIGQPYKITYYGIRIAPLKIWPNVIRIYPLENQGDYQREIEEKRRRRRERVKRVTDSVKSGLSAGWDTAGETAQTLKRHAGDFVDNVKKMKVPGDTLPP